MHSELGQGRGGWVVGATCSSGPLFGLCSYARGWLTPAKLIRDLRKTRSFEAKAQARQTNTCQLPLATITFNIFGVEIQQHNSWRPLLTKLHRPCQLGHPFLADGHTMSNAPDLF